MTTARISLDSPVFHGRLRTFARRSYVERREVRLARPQLVSDVRAVKVQAVKTTPQPTKAFRQHPVAPTAQSRPAKSLVLKREAVRQPEVSKPTHKKSFGGMQKKLLTALAILLFVVGIGVAIDGFLTNRHVEAQVEQSMGGSGDAGAAMVGDIPSEGDRPDVNAYKAAPTLPRKISIPILGVEARVLKLGTTASGVLASPASIYDAGWYDGSSKPGESGAMLLDGHVHGPTLPGVFADLKKLKRGDTLSVERGDGQMFTYKVVKLQTYPADSMDMMGAALTPITPGKPGLNLMTCTGEIDKTTNHYKDRLVVFAEQQ